MIPDDENEFKTRVTSAVAKEFGIDEGRVITVKFIEALVKAGVDSEQACLMNVAGLLVGKHVDPVMTGLNHLATEHGSVLAANAMQALLPLIEYMEREFANGYSKIRDAGFIPKDSFLVEDNGSDMPTQQQIDERRDRVSAAVKRAHEMSAGQAGPVSRTHH